MPVQNVIYRTAVMLNSYTLFTFYFIQTADMNLYEFGRLTPLMMTLSDLESPTCLHSHTVSTKPFADKNSDSRYNHECRLRSFKMRTVNKEKCCEWYIFFD